MSATARHGALPWAIMAMELSLLYPLAAALLGGHGPAALPRTAAGLALLPLGYLAARASRLPESTRQRLAVGAAASLALRLTVTWPAEPLALGVLARWGLLALWPGAIGLALAWRGAWLAETEITAEGVRQEFAVLGGVLLVILGVYANTLGIDAAMRALMVLLYLGGGLLAIGLARQAAAGAMASPGSGALVALCAALLLLFGAGLVALLSPSLVSVVLALVQEVILALLQVVLFPLMLLLAWLQLELPEPPERSSNAQPPPPQAPPLTETLPPWLLDALGIALIVAVVVVSALVLLVLIWALWELLGSIGRRPGMRRPVAVEQDGGPRDVLAGLLGTLRRWLGGVPLPRPGESLADARACYRALLRWSRGRGVERAPAETPAELGARLARLVPEGEAHIDALTAAYERARYGGLPVGEPELARLRRHLRALASLAAEQPPERAP